jgi:hypothetical protein
MAVGRGSSSVISISHGLFPDAMLFDEALRSPVLRFSLPNEPDLGSDQGYPAAVVVDSQFDHNDDN